MDGERSLLVVRGQKLDKSSQVIQLTDIPSADRASVQQRMRNPPNTRTHTHRNGVKECKPLTFHHTGWPTANRGIHWDCSDYNWTIIINSTERSRGVGLRLGSTAERSSS